MRRQWVDHLCNQEDLVACKGRRKGRCIIGKAGGGTKSCPKGFEQRDQLPLSSDFSLLLLPLASLITIRGRKNVDIYGAPTNCIYYTII